MRKDTFWAIVFAVVSVLSAVLVISMPASGAPAKIQTGNTLTVKASSTTTTPGTPVTFNGTTTGGPPNTFSVSSVLLDSKEDSTFEGATYVPSSNSIFIGSYQSSNVVEGAVVLNASTHSIVKFIGGGIDGINDMQYDPGQNTVWLFNRLYNNFSVVNAATNTVSVASVTTDDDPGNTQGSAYNPSGVVYVNCFGAGIVDIFNDTTHTLVHSINLDSAPLYGTYSVAYDSSKNEILVGGDNDNMMVINAATYSTVATIAVGNSPQEGVVYLPNYGEFMVSNKGSSNVTVINDTTNTVTANIPVGSDPITLTYGGGLVYVANYGSANVSIINPATNRVIANPNVGLYPFGGAFDSSNGQFFVPNSYAYAANVSVIQAPHSVFAYNFGDGSTGTGRNPVHTYATPGTYTVEAWWNWTGNSIESTPITVTVSSGKTPPGSTTISGFVSNASTGNPIPSARVLTSLGNNTTVNSQGYYSFTLLDSYKQTQVCAYAESYATLCQNVSLTGAGVSLNFLLDPSGLTPVGGLTGVTVTGPLAIAIGGSATYTANATCRGGCSYPSYLLYSWTLTNGNANITSGAASATMTLKGVNAGPETVVIQVFQLSTGTTAWYNLHINVTSGGGGAVIFLGLSQGQWIEVAEILLIVAVVLVVADLVRKRWR